MRTFYICFRDGLWHVEDGPRDAGGLFTTLTAALTFARREAAPARAARIVVRSS